MLRKLEFYKQLLKENPASLFDASKEALLVTPIVDEMEKRGIRPSIWRASFIDFFEKPYLPELMVPLFSEENRALLDSFGYVLANGKKCYTFESDEAEYYVEKIHLESLWQNEALKTLTDLKSEQKNEAIINLSLHANYYTISDFVESLLYTAIDRRASDIHLDIEDNHFVISIRVDGVLKRLWNLPAHLHHLTINRLKVISNMDLVEKRLPQDGHFVAHLDDISYHFRLATLGMLRYEKMVIRILPQKTDLMDLEMLGMLPEQISDLLQASSTNQGLILITGPTNSGKSTLLYTLLKKHISEGKSIFTIEDPVETEVEQLYQIEVSQKGNLDFAKGLRGILRQDPDIIAIGELRDEETLDIALKAALTGHLVYATLHSTDALSAVARLINMGADKVILSSVLRYVTNQRLVRRCCHHDGNSFCALCQGSGYYGRIGLFETWKLSKEMKEFILKDQLTPMTLLHHVEKHNYISLKDAIIYWLDRGIIDKSEVGQYL